MTVDKYILDKKQLPEITIKYKKSVCEKVKISCSDDAAEIFKRCFDSDTIDYQEACMVLFLDRSNKTIGWFKLSEGGLTSTIIDNRIVFTTALNCGATSFIMAHNHPSGNLNPSNSDYSITKKLQEGGKYLDINMLDHIIITSENGYYSMADNGFC